MKLLVLLLALMFGVWLWGRGRAPEDRLQGQKKRRRRAEPPALAQVMVACDRCGVHVPEARLIAGRDGRRYCCEAHRQEAERA